MEPVSETIVLKISHDFCESGELCWIARTADGQCYRQSYFQYAIDAAHAVRSMFRPNEIVGFVDHGKTATVIIRHKCASD